MSDDALIEAMAKDMAEMAELAIGSLPHGKLYPTLATAALAALRKTHAVVPREPTEAMLATFHDTVQIACYPDEKAASIVNDRQVYRALLNTSEATDADQ